MSTTPASNPNPQQPTPSTTANVVVENLSVNDQAKATVSQALKDTMQQELSSASKMITAHGSVWGSAHLSIP